MKNVLIILVLAVSAATAYLSNQAVDNTAATHEAQCLANGVVEAMQHFQMLSKKTMDLALHQRVRAMQLEQYIRDNGLPVPPVVTAPQTKPQRPDEVI